MIKTSRKIDTILFHLESGLTLPNNNLSYGWNQIIDKGNNYYQLISFSNRDKIDSFNSKDMPLLLEFLFPKQL